MYKLHVGLADYLALPTPKCLSRVNKRMEQFTKIEMLHRFNCYNPKTYDEKWVNVTLSVFNYIRTWRNGF
jgi:hypothetical protein